MKNICLLLEGVAGLYYANLWPGIVAAAKENDCNVVCFAGGALKMSPNNPYEVRRNIIYDYVDVTKFDGLIISGTLKNFISEAEFATFMEKFHGLPAVSLAPALPHIPSLVVDNTSGMKSLISHLAHDHKCRRFAFIGGPKGNLDADERLELFRKYLGEYNLECNEGLLIAGDFSRSGGYKAAIELLRKNIQFDALLAANDETALGAIQALLDNEIRVPEDVAVTGFDNIEESELTTPPLTTVRQPLKEIGRTAVELLLAKMRGQEVPMRTPLQTPLMIRQSCGCFINPKHSLDNRTQTLSVIQMPSDKIDRLKEQLAETLYNFVSMEMAEEDILLEVDDLKGLASSFFDEIAGAAANTFLPALNRIVRAAALSDDNDDILQWQKILVLARKYTEGLNRAQKETADNLLHEGYNLFGETASRLQAHKRLQAEQKAAMMRSAGNAIANSFDFAALTDAVVNAFPKLEISDFYLSMYDKTTKGFLNSKPIFALQRGKKSAPPPDSFFPTKDLIPGGTKDGDTPYQMFVQPLHFKNEQLGMAVFKDGPLTGYIYDILGEQLSGAIQGAQMVNKIQEQRLILEEANRELTILREQEHLRLEAIKRELQIGRTIQESFLPESMPVMPGWESRALFMPAREVSGDFYDAFIFEDGRAAFVIADVSGKDVGAALFMSLIRSLIRAFSENATEGANPLNAVELTNRYIVHHHHTSKGRFMYATMFFAVVDPNTGEVTYINAGHNHPALLSHEGKIKRWLAPTGPAVGVGIKEDLKYRQETFTLEPGEMLLLYTDGVIEAKNESGEFLTQKRFAELIEKPYETLDEVVDRVKDTLKEHCGAADPYDDVTMMGIFRKIG
ncbi:MAG: SpoIIE family protein phosphatase [Chitinispirillia bacterium]|nr:SpoIIE family protein phosphatase [Chitinispirillia bacterium]MCL2268721.1 SpoIIE family protein phosphatase [Chitinispirillia bacterium]